MRICLLLGIVILVVSSVQSSKANEEDILMTRLKKNTNCTNYIIGHHTLNEGKYVHAELLDNYAREFNKANTPTKLKIVKDIFNNLNLNKSKKLKMFRVYGQNKTNLLFHYQIHNNKSASCICDVKNGDNKNNLNATKNNTKPYLKQHKTPEDESESEDVQHDSYDISSEFSDEGETVKTNKEDFNGKLRKLYTNLRKDLFIDDEVYRLSDSDDEEEKINNDEHINSDGNSNDNEYINIDDNINMNEDGNDDENGNSDYDIDDYEDWYDDDYSNEDNGKSDNEDTKDNEDRNNHESKSDKNDTKEDENIDDDMNDDEDTNNNEDRNNNDTNNEDNTNDNEDSKNSDDMSDEEDVKNDENTNDDVDIDDYEYTDDMGNKDKDTNSNTLNDEKWITSTINSLKEQVDIIEQNLNNLNDICFEVSSKLSIIDTKLKNKTVMIKKSSSKKTY